MAQTMTITQAWAKGYVDAYNGQGRKRGQSADYYAGYDAVDSIRLVGQQLVAVRRLAIGIA